MRVMTLDEFRHSMAGMNRGLDPKVHRLLDKAAVLVAGKARRRVPIGPAAGGHAASSVRPFSSSKSAGVVGGGGEFPYYAWLDFGGSTGGGGHRPYLRKGRYIWFAFASERKGILRDADGVLEDLGATVNIEVDRGSR